MKTPTLNQIELLNRAVNASFREPTQEQAAEAA